MKEFKKDLNKANELRTVGKNIEAVELFEKCYKMHPEEFSFKQKNDYAWAVYKTKIAFFKDEEELFENAELITQLVEQRNFNRVSSCVYTSSVFKVLNHFKDEDDFPSMIPWLEKLNPDLLDEKPYRKYERWNRSHRELYYDWASRAYYRNMDFEKCIEMSQKALEEVSRFHDDGEAWFKWRITKSLMELGRIREALDWCLEVVKVKHEWYIYRDIARIYLMLKKPWLSLDYLCPAVLSDVSQKTKMNVYYLCFRVLKSSNMPMAIKHAEFYLILRRKYGYSIPYEIEMLDIDESALNEKELESEIRDLWIRYKFKNHKIRHGTVAKFFNDRNFGFINDESGESIFFHRDEFKGDEVFVGQMVSFYSEDSFDKSKNKKSVKAVYVRGE